MSGTRTLVLMRHAKAEISAAGGDEMRSLSLAGRRQASRAGLALLAAEFLPEVVLCSPAIRTRQTADLAITSLGCRGELDLLFPERLYRGYVTEVLEEISVIDSRIRSVLVVGHEPTISATAAHLASEDSNEDALASVNRGLRTASCAMFQVPEPWNEISQLGGRLAKVIETPTEH